MHEQKPSTKKVKLAIIVTVPSFFVHIINNIKEYQKNGFEVELISSHAEYGQFLRNEHGFSVTEINIPRNISPLQDLISLWNLYRHFRKNSYDIVHSGTPKAGLLVALAGKIARVPVRLHTFTGQRWATIKGPLRFLLKKLDQLIIRLNTRCYADSPSQIQFLVDSGVAKAGAVHCLHKGSFGGIDPAHFERSQFPQARQDISKKLNLDSGVPWILYVGRITANKGTKELISAFLNSLEKTDSRLLIMGDFEGIHPEHDAVWVTPLQNHPKIKQIPFQTNPEYYMAAADFLCLPSYREGFGTVVLEAAASGICAIGTDIPGLRDAIADGESGILVPLLDITALENAIVKLVTNEPLRLKLGQNALKRAAHDFDYKTIAQLQMHEYQNLLKR
jgi:glycosyltransferase involved in cell wall biosynthesis